MRATGLTAYSGPKRQGAVVAWGVKGLTMSLGARPLDTRPIEEDGSTEKDPRHLLLGWLPPVWRTAVEVLG